MRCRDTTGINRAVWMSSSPVMTCVSNHVHAFLIFAAVINADLIGMNRLNNNLGIHQEGIRQKNNVTVRQNQYNRTVCKVMLASLKELTETDYVIKILKQHNNMFSHCNLKKVTTKQHARRVAFNKFHI